MARRVVVAWAMALAVAASASAQSGSSGTSTGQSSATTQTPSSSAPPEETRPATTTFFGDTGLWFVPTGEVLGHGKWSASAYRRGTNWIQGYSNVADFAGTFGVGIRNRAEIFGSFLVDTRIDRDVRPVFVADPTFGGVVERYPKVNQYWTGDNLGDFYIGAKVNLLSEHENDPAAFAVRGIFKLPTGDTDNGVSTGKMDFAIDAVVSKESVRRAEVAGYAGIEWRGQPDGFDTPGAAFRWGGGIGFPSRNVARLTAELNGVIPTGSEATITGTRLVGIDGSLAPLTSDTEALTRATIGVTVQTRKGFFF